MAGCVGRRAHKLAMFAACPECRYCGRPVTNVTSTIDHIVPKNGGGKNVLSNLTLACRICNSFKGCKSVQVWEQIVEFMRADNFAGMDYCQRKTWMRAALRRVTVPVLSEKKARKLRERLTWKASSATWGHPIPTGGESRPKQPAGAITRVASRPATTPAGA